jgi:beta-aspartyl-dipeptidase (metallo-type)
VILIVTGGEVFTPAPAGAATVLALNGAIARVGPVDTKALETLDVPLQVLEAHDCVVVPGLIDPHVHLIGGSGEEGYDCEDDGVAVRVGLTPATNDFVSLR